MATESQPQQLVFSGSLLQYWETNSQGPVYYLPAPKSWLPAQVQKVERMEGLEGSGQAESQAELVTKWTIQ